MTNKEAADILRLMPKQSEAIKKAIEVLERTKWHTNPPTEEGEYLVVCKYMRFVEMAKYSKNFLYTKATGRGLLIYAYARQSDKTESD